jgi:hypothetical protein
MNNKITDMNSLYEAYKASMKGSAWKEEPQRFEIDFLSEITKLHQELENRTYKTSKGTEFTITERGKTRRIKGGRMRDRVVRHALCDQELTDALQPYLIYNNGASQKGKGVSFSRKMFERDLHNYWLKHRTNEGYVGFVDLSKFYDNIQHDKIKEAINPKIDEFSQWLLSEILTTFEIDVSYMSDDEYAHCTEQKFDSVEYHKTVPEKWRTGEKMMRKSVDIGDQVSQDIGIFYPTEIDNYAKIVRGCEFYGRHTDDIYIIGETREYVQSVINGITKVATRQGLFINKKKTRIAKLSDTYKYLQVRYTLTDTGKAVGRIAQKSVTIERRRIKSYKRQLDAGKMTHEDIKQAVKSWMGTHTKRMSKRQIKNMKQLYKELFGKELLWKKQKSHTTQEKRRTKNT